MDSLPEELLERILGLTLPSPKSIDILCVSSTFYRVALPLVYRTVKLRSASSCQKLLEHPDAPSVRPHTLVITHSALYSPLLPAVLTRYGSNVEEVDITMTMPIFDNKRDNAEDIKALCEALAGLHRIKRFTLRKAPGMPFYLGAPWVKDFVAGLAQALSGGQRWNSLESVYIALKMSQLDAFARLLSSLSTLPKLHTLATDMPSVWNDLLLQYTQQNTTDTHILLLLPGAHFHHETISNPNLVVSATTPFTHTNTSNMGLCLAMTSLYMRHAREHETLAENLSVVAPPTEAMVLDRLTTTPMGAGGRDSVHRAQTWSTNSLHRIWSKAVTAL